MSQISYVNLRRCVAEAQIVVNQSLSCEETNPLSQSKLIPWSHRHSLPGEWDWKNATRVGEAENPGPHVRGRAPVTTIVSYNVGSAMGNVKMAVDWLTKRGEYERHGSSHHVQLVQEYSNQADANNREFAFWKDCARRAILTTSSVPFGSVGYQYISTV